MYNTERKISPYHCTHVSVFNVHHLKITNAMRARGEPHLVDEDTMELFRRVVTADWTSSIVLGYLNPTDMVFLVHGIDITDINPSLCSTTIKYVRKAIAVRGCWEAAKLMFVFSKETITDHIHYLYRYFSHRKFTKFERAMWNIRGPRSLIEYARNNGELNNMPWRVENNTESHRELVLHNLCQMFDEVMMTISHGGRYFLEAVRSVIACHVYGQAVRERIWKRKVIPYGYYWWGHSNRWSSAKIDRSVL